MNGAFPTNIIENIYKKLRGDPRPNDFKLLKYSENIEIEKLINILGELRITNDTRESFKNKADVIIKCFNCGKKGHKKQDFYLKNFASFLA